MGGCAHTEVRAGRDPPGVPNAEGDRPVPLDDPGPSKPAPDSTGPKPVKEVPLTGIEKCTGSENAKRVQRVVQEDWTRPRPDRIAPDVRKKKGGASMPFVKHGPVMRGPFGSACLLRGRIFHTLAGRAYAAA